MEPALVLTEEAAADNGYSGAGPFTFPGFPGVFYPGQPVAISELGFATADDAAELVEEVGVALEQTEVASGEGKVERYNHAASQEQELGEELDELEAIRTHADADAKAAELGFEFPESAKTVAEKREAIAAFIAAAAGQPEPAGEEADA